MSNETRFQRSLKSLFTLISPTDIIATILLLASLGVVVHLILDPIPPSQLPEQLFRHVSTVLR